MAPEPMVRGGPGAGTGLAATSLLVAIWLFATVMTVAGVLASMPSAVTANDIFVGIIIFALLSGMAGLGVLIVERSGNLIGWLLSVGALVLAYQLWGTYRTVGLIEEWLGTSILYWASLLLVPLVILLFPTGRLPSRRWWPVWWLGGGGVLAATSSSLFAPTIWGSDQKAPWAGVMSETALTVLDVLSFVLFIPFIVAVVAAPIVRYRRAEGVERLQFKWFGLGAVVAFVGWLITQLIGYDQVDPEIPGAISLIALPLSITVAILRYRLFEINRLISRAVGYTVVVVALGLVYIVGAIWLPTRVMGEQTPIFVAGSTLAVAALFNPVRRRVIRAVDHRFYRSRYNAERVLDDFGERLKDQIDVDQIAEDSVAVIRQTVQPSFVSVWIRR